MKEKSFPPVFVQGAISMNFIAKIIRQHNRNTLTGAYSIFLGQVRSDETQGTRVQAVEYTTHTALAMEQFHRIHASVMAKYPLFSLQVFHSTGMVPAGEICFFVLAASMHRTEAIKACNETVERVKAEMAIWGRLLLEDDRVEWKENN
ncbi:MAG TPA: molybdenum cofactor biosynthesis protein MoaE [Bacteroidales bacterium]|nr:molybdenum cofactor biosynthesis protein MoaE [Bacteroidales bacterium]